VLLRYIKQREKESATGTTKYEKCTGHYETVRHSYCKPETRLETFEDLAVDREIVETGNKE
jgi:hypothetical protein